MIKQVSLLFKGKRYILQQLPYDSTIKNIHYYKNHCYIISFSLFSVFAAKRYGIINKKPQMRANFFIYFLPPSHINELQM